jgi:uncharacterized membrane protein YjgN (DUF898 family)
MRGLLRSGESAAVLALMFAGAMALWIGVPVAWLWIGSRIQEATDSVGAALGVMFVGAVVTIGAIVPLLGRLNEGYAHLREARGQDSFGQAPLEAVLVVSAFVAVVLFIAWFVVAGGAPNPVPDGSG